MNEGCIFCEIAQGKVPATKVAENSYCLAFLDIYPVVEAHTLIIPKQHYQYVWDIPDKTLSEMMSMAKKLAKHFQKVTGYEVVYSSIVGLGVPHAHIHLLPNTDKGYGKAYSHFEKEHSRHATQEELKKLQERYSLQ